MSCGLKLATSTLEKYIEQVKSIGVLVFLITYALTNDLDKLPEFIDFFVAKGIPCKHTLGESFDDLSCAHSSVMLTLIKSVTMRKFPLNNRTN